MIHFIAQAELFPFALFNRSMWSAELSPFLGLKLLSECQKKVIPRVQALWVLLSEKKNENKNWIYNQRTF